MHSTELFFRQEADRAREQIRNFRNEQRERRQDSMQEARREINIYLEQGMDRNIAINFVLDKNKISIVDRKEVRRFFKYGCHTICGMVEELHDINRENSSNLVLEAV